MIFSTPRPNPFAVILLGISAWRKFPVRGRAQFQESNRPGFENQVCHLSRRQSLANCLTSLSPNCKKRTPRATLKSCEDEIPYGRYLTKVRSLHSQSENRLSGCFHANQPAWLVSSRRSPDQPGHRCVGSDKDCHSSCARLEQFQCAVEKTALTPGAYSPLPALPMFLL